MTPSSPHPRYVCNPAAAAAAAAVQRLNRSSSWTSEARKWTAETKALLVRRVVPAAAEAVAGVKN